MNPSLLTIEREIPIPPRYATKPNGLCTHCYRQPRSGLKTCDYHLAKVRNATNARKAKGLCAWGTANCTNDVEPPHVICAEHRLRMLQDNNARREKRKAQKMCIGCGTRPQWWTLYCLVCRFHTGHKYQFILPSGARRAIHKYRRLEKIEARRACAETALPHVQDNRSREILIARHGLRDGLDRTLEEIGARFLVTRERIRQIEKKILDQLESRGIGVSLLRPPFEEIQRRHPSTRNHLTTKVKRNHSAAHGLVAKALASGELVKKPCEAQTPNGICGKAKVVGHHEDYNKPLEVIWLCRGHHMRAHGRGKGEPQPKKEHVNWLDKITPHPQCVEIWRTLRAHRAKLKDIKQATGISQVHKVLTSDPPVSVFLKLQAYAETLAEREAKAA